MHVFNANVYSIEILLFFVVNIQAEEKNPFSNHNSVFICWKYNWEKHGIYSEMVNVCHFSNGF